MNFDFILNTNLLFFYAEQVFYYSAQFFLHYAIWLFLTFFVLKIVWKRWLINNKKKYLAKQKYVLLGIRMPKDNQQGPEAVERFFVHLSGIKENFNWWEKNIEGKRQLNISLEIISIEGQIQFFIHTPVQFLDLVESAIYTSYPSLEIFEQKQDYADNALEEFLENRCNVWGTDLEMTEKNPIPIKTYPQFEHKLSKELKDPLINLLEILGRLRKGEQVWLQFVITPIGLELKKEGEKLIEKLLFGKNINKSSQNVADKTVLLLMKLGQNMVEIIKDALGLHQTIEKHEEEKYISSSANKHLAEAIEDKISKIAFKSCVRIVYLADKEVFSKDRGIVGILSAFNAFSSIGMNSFKLSPVSKVYKENFGSNKISGIQKQEIIKAYKKRIFSWRARVGFSKTIHKIRKFLVIPERSAPKSVLNIEELATLYHFPVNMINASLIQKTSSKRAEPPLGLPTK